MVITIHSWYTNQTFLSVFIAAFLSFVFFARISDIIADVIPQLYMGQSYKSENKRRCIIVRESLTPK